MEEEIEIYKPFQANKYTSLRARQTAVALSASLQSHSSKYEDSVSVPDHYSADPRNSKIYER
jgi:hypothetical protein